MKSSDAVTKYGFSFYILTYRYFLDEGKVHDGNEYWQLYDEHNIVYNIPAKNSQSFYYANVTLVDSDDPDYFKPENNYYLAKKVTILSYHKIESLGIWTNELVCRIAFSRRLFSLIKCMDESFLTWIGCREDLLFLSAGYRDLKIEFLRKYPHLIKTQDFEQDPLIHEFIYYEFPEYLEYIRDPSPSMIKKIITKDPKYLNVYEVTDMGFLHSLIKKKPHLIMMVRSPEYGLYEAALDSRPDLFTSVPLRVGIRYLFEKFIC